MSANSHTTFTLSLDLTKLKEYKDFANVSLRRLENGTLLLFHTSRHPKIPNGKLLELVGWATKKN